MELTSLKRNDAMQNVSFAGKSMIEFRIYALADELACLPPTPRFKAQNTAAQFIPNFIFLPLQVFVAFVV